MFAHRACAQNASKVEIPSDGDKYSKFVKQLEVGQTNVNYTEFRSRRFPRSLLDDRITSVAVGADSVFV